MEHEQHPGITGNTGQQLWEACRRHELGQIGHKRAKALLRALAPNLPDLRIKGAMHDECNRPCLVWDRPYGRSPKIHVIGR